MLALREEREIAQAHISARQQALIYTESEQRRRERAGPQPGQHIGDVHANSSVEPAEAIEELPFGAPHRAFQRRGELKPGYDLAETSYLNLDLSREKQWLDAEAGFGSLGGNSATPRFTANGQDVRPHIEPTTPAWLHGSQTSLPPAEPQAALLAFGSEIPERESLHNSRERVAARWYALKGVVEYAGPLLPASRRSVSTGTHTPLLAVFSLVGGVGKTSLVATLGRAFSLQNEKVLLTDTTSYGLLPFYFGAHELRPGVLRSFVPPAESAGEAISLVMYDAAADGAEMAGRQLLTEEILGHAQNSHRLLLDLSSGSSWLARQMADFHPTVLVPIAPDMNSVISLQTVERLFAAITDSQGRPILPYYVLNQFDASLPLHLDVREVFRRQLGDRLLPFAIRRSPAVSEALAEGMTVLDYAPDAPVSQDYLDVASWLVQAFPARHGRFPQPGPG